MSYETTLPLSIAQRGLWIGEQLAPTGAIFNIAEALELDGAIDPALLLRALRLVTQEMETIRVRLVRGVGLPRQAIMPQYEHPIALHDFSVESDPRDAAKRFMVAELSAPLDPEIGPLWVSAVLKLSDRSWYWYHRAHHIMLDGYSGGMVVQRVAALYTALRQQREPEPAQFSTLSVLLDAERTYRASDHFERDRTYWRTQLADIPEPVTLTRRNGQRTGGLLRSTGTLPFALVQRLRERLTGTTTSMPQALIGLVAAYYARMTGAQDFVFAMPVTARIGSVTRRCPGMVANAVPIRIRLSPDDTVATVIAQAARTVRTALRHQRYRYEDLRRDLGLMKPGQQIARLGVNIEPFDYSLTFDGVTLVPDNLSNAQMEDLTIFIYDRLDEQGLRVDIDADPGLYDQAELDRHQKRLHRIVHAFIETPDLPIGEVELLDADDRERLLHRWNDTASTSDTADPDIVTLFRKQAAATPDAPAIASDTGASLSYRELDRRRGALAARLQGLCIHAGDLVAVALPRSELLAETLLAILHTGAAYLPLDPNGPDERLAMILSDARPALVITLEEHGTRFAGLGIGCLLLDRPMPVVPRELAAPDAPLDPGAVAYVIYTSGSTGRPKGVTVLHGGLSNFLLGMADLLQPTPADRLLSVTTITFDIAGLELFLPLMTGAQVVIASGNTLRDPLALGRLLQSHRITMLQATPSLWRSLLANRSALLEGVHAMVGGEALSPELAARMLERCARVTNLYGPTETTIWSTAMALSPDDIEPPPLGRPIRNTQVYVLDERMQPVPEGMTGMLYIGGAGVARGYLHRDDLTVQSFGRNPFAPAGNGSRLYRTGDLARWRADGVLEYLGRQDQQVKLHGYRIELGEIETALQRHEAVADAAVAIRPDPRGEPALVAYLVTAPGCPDPSETVLRRYLASLVPDYMIPSLFMLLEALPLNTSGKVDRKALPTPLRADRPVAVLELPQTRTERRLAAIWENVLGRHGVGVHENFFEIGGDSLSGAQMLVEIEEAFAHEIPLDSLFRAATIADLASLLDGNSTVGSLDMVLPLRSTGDKPPLFCIHPVTGLGWSYAALMPHLDERRPLYALQASGLGRQSGGAGSLPQSIEEMAACYLAEMRAVQPEGPYHLLGWSLGGLVAHAITAQLRRGGQEVAFLALLDSYPFKLGPEADAIDERTQVRLAMEFLGIDRAGDRIVPPETMSELAALLWEHDDALAQPLVQAIVRSEEGIMTRLEQVVRNNLALARRYDPQPVDVDALFLWASVRSSSSLDSVMNYKPSMWQRLVRSLAIYEIDCHHQDILSATAIGPVGGLLRRYLQAIDARQAPLPPGLPFGALGVQSVDA